MTTGDWQLALILWGTKYGVDEVNHLVGAIRRLTAKPPSVVLITDRERAGLADGVRQCAFPEFFLRPGFLGSGCQAKLAMFERDVLPQDLPTIYVDLDTAVFGDLAQLLELQTSPDTIAMLQSAILPFGPIGRFAARLSDGRRYARGNSSLMVFRPSACYHITEQFRTLYARHGGDGFKPMRADERFISWSAQRQMRAIPRRMAVKLPTEFMLPWRWLIRLRASLPWVRRRWEGLIAVTLPGSEVKGSALVGLAEGDEIVDRKGRRLIWSGKTLGSVQEKLVKYYSSSDGSRSMKGSK